MGTEHSQHQFNHLLIIFLKVISKGLFDNSEVYKSLMQLSIFLIDLFVGTYRLSSHARLEAFVIQAKLRVQNFAFLKRGFEL